MSKYVEDDLAQLARAAGFRATTPRLLVLSYLQKTKRPVTIQEIVQGVGRNNIDQVTVYRIITAFSRAGIIARIDFKHGHAHYELKDLKDHHHIVCTDCGKVEDFRGCDFKGLANKGLKQTRGFAEVTDHSLELFGICNVCARKEKRLLVA